MQNDVLQPVLAFSDQRNKQLSNLYFPHLFLKLILRSDEPDHRSVEKDALSIFENHNLKDDYKFNITKHLQH